MSRLGVLINPTAGHGRAGAGGRDALALLGRSGHEVIDLSRHTAEAALARARDTLWELDALVVVGGDGMVHLGVNVVAGTTVPLGIVPFGSGNDLARTLGLAEHDVRRAVADVLAALEGAPRVVDAIATRVHMPAAEDADPAGSAAASAAPHGDELEDPTAVEWTACVLSAGIDAAVNHRANTYRWPQGGGRYVRGTLAELTVFHSYGYRLTIDGVVREQDAVLVALANAPSFGGGMHIAPQAQMDDGWMDVVIGHAMGRAQLLRLFPRLYRGTHVHSPRVEVLRAREVVLEPLPGRRRPPPVYADGELLGRLPLRARLRPGALRLLTPEAT
ncbi:MAG TPA: diacylglycerol kinase family lipid kinase [Candidatus Ruania gallistercoris]|uniref:Diacylglycerol kinase family lipid kinase n=1 Tax=Candidatus Ruania gallistercoris TaxID=2838746 RepID=A0A9D2J5Q8_9MICO|nr:diacylglycerol kinase family lipid kinase [Candidatus Ruania gallistercoris]